MTDIIHIMTVMTFQFPGHTFKVRCKIQPKN